MSDLTALVEELSRALDQKQQERDTLAAELQGAKEQGDLLSGQQQELKLQLAAKD